MNVLHVFGPLQKLSECRATMAVLSLFLGGQLGKGLLDLREEKQRIVAEPIRATSGMKDKALRLAVKRCQGMSVTGHGDHADEPARTKLLRNLVQLTQQTRIVRLIVRVT